MTKANVVALGSRVLALYIDIQVIPLHGLLTAASSARGLPEFVVTAQVTLLILYALLALLLWFAANFIARRITVHSAGEIVSSTIDLSDLQSVAFGLLGMFILVFTAIEVLNYNEVILRNGGLFWSFTVVACSKAAAAMLLILGMRPFLVVAQRLRGTRGVNS